MTRDELLKVVRGVIGEEREVFLCEIFEDSLGKSIRLRYRLHKMPQHSQNLLLRYSSAELFDVYKSLQNAGLVGYALSIFTVDAAGGNRYFMESEIAKKRPIAVYANQAGNRWKIGVLNPSDRIPEMDEVSVDLAMEMGKVKLSEEEINYLWKIMARVRR